MKQLLFLPRKPSLRQRIMLLLGALLLLAVLVFALTYRDRLGLPLFSRWLSYDNESGVTFSHGARGEDLFYGLDYRLLTCSDGAMQLYSPTGELLFREQNTFANPALSSNGRQAVVYDADGQLLYVVSKEKIVFSLVFPAEQYVRAATLNQSGWMAVTAKQPGFRGVVTIYNASYLKAMTISLSDHYPVDAVVTPDCKGVFVLTEGQNNGVFESRLLYYTFDDEEPRSQVSLGDQLVLALRSTSNRVWALAENSLSTFLSSGELAAQYDFRGDYLRQASLDGTDFATLLLSPSQSGSNGRIVTLDLNCAELGSLELDRQVLSVKAAGRYVGVLTANELLLYHRDLERLVSTTEQIQGVRGFALFSDGSLALISDELARLYVP